MFFRSLGVAVIRTALLIGSAQCGMAVAQQKAVEIAEPKRFALVIGNAKYGHRAGNLTRLGSPCADDENSESDAKAVAEAFADAKWEVEKLCNLETAELRTKINDFNDRVLEVPRALGVIYFSGHGAHVAGMNYIFGVDAEFKPEVEYSKYKQHPHARLFGKAAVALDDAMSQLRHLWGKAVVVVVDACRDNPIVDEFRTKKVVTAQYPVAATQLPNVVFAFATAAGEVAPDGGPGNVSRYARFFAEEIRRSGSVSTNVEIEHLLSATRTKVIKDSAHRQIPSKIGDLQRPPVFCMKGCPSLMEEWETLGGLFGLTSVADEFIKPAMLAQTGGVALRPARNGYVAPRMQTTGHRSGSRTGNARLFFTSQATNRVEPQAPDDESADPGLRQLKVDILYCSGDALIEERRARASQLQQYLEGLTGERSPVRGFEIGATRILPLPPNINQRVYKTSDSAVVYSKNNPAAFAWADHIRVKTRPVLRMAPQAGSSSEFLTVLICDGVDLTSKQTVVYLHVGNDDHRRNAQALLGDLQTAVPEANVIRGIEIVKSLPKKSDLRYFFPEQKEFAVHLAGAASEVFGTAVTPRLIRGYENRLKGTAVMEIWLAETPKRASE
ncbi:caspase family protein [Pseudoduganella lutea]|uniref:Caspase family protein n=1 Tax=Pseudoduganella lutea TaxID=321985 RepID=A0A4P6L3A4_9BURK|nr:caspase family protein [Pseudoduganella lutea]QBE65765.1 caspase family protein [Pseudoduganella lutea]